MLLAYLPVLIFEAYLEMLSEPALVTQPRKSFDKRTRDVGLPRRKY